MAGQYVMDRRGVGISGIANRLGLDLSRRAVVAIILIVALFAFEVFNFDTTRYALTNLMGDVRFLGFQWAAILAIAFCSIDFAGLVRLFTPEKGRDEPKEVWYLMGAWLLGATMNALMTWWAVSLTLLNHDFGNEVLSREQLLDYVPVFVAVLVWLTRILFIGAFTVAGEHIFDLRDWRARRSATAGKGSQPGSVRSVARPRSRPPVSGQMAFRGNGDDNARQTVTPPNNTRGQGTAANGPARPRRNGHSRIRQRPPMPGSMRRMPLNGAQAKSRN